MLMRFDHDNTITALAHGRTIELAHLTDEDRIAAAPYSPAIAGAILAGKFTLNRAVWLGRQVGLIAHPDTTAARAAGLIK